MNPDCYEEKGIVKVSQELDNINISYEEKMEEYLLLEEIIDNF